MWGTAEMIRIHAQNLTLFVFVQLLLLQSTCAQEGLENQLSEIAERAAKDGFTGIVVAERSGMIVASYSVGFADRELTKPINSKTLFEIGSVTKPVTAFAVVKLARDGKLALDDSIADHLPDVPENCRPITIRHLLQHTSGMPGTNYGPLSTDVEVVTRAYLRGGPQTQPGTRFEYWNQGYALLAAIVAKASGHTYQEAVRELVFRPAEMSHSCFTGDKPPEGLPVSIGKSTIGADRSALDHPYGDFYGLQYQGMGGVVTNVDDLVQFVQMLRKCESEFEEIFQPGPDKVYGLGWRIEQIDETHRRVSHSGAVRGFLASVSWYPEDDSSLIVLANTDAKAGFMPVEAGCRRAFEATFIQLPENRSFAEDLRSSVVGQYQLQTRVITISEVGDALEIVIDWGGPKTFGTLAKTSSPTRLRLLDGSGEDVFVSLLNKRNKQFQALEILGSQYPRLK